MFVLKLSLCLLAVAPALGQGPTTTPVPILKQINKQNDDGSYSYGYEAADGSFKIETKYPNGDVAGKYGYVDEGGQQREISYGASSKRGFEPQGAGIVVPPPSISEPTSNALTDGQEDDGQYREDPKIYEDPKYNSRQHKTKGPIQTFKQFHAPTAPAYQPTQTHSFQPALQRQTYQPSRNSIFDQAPQQFDNQDVQPRPQSQVYHQQPQFSYQGYTTGQQYQPNYQQQQYQPNYQQQQQQYQPFQQQRYQPNYQQQAYQTQNYNPFFGHPAQNFDPSTGSYTINFTG